MSKGSEKFGYFNKLNNLHGSFFFFPFIGQCPINNSGFFSRILLPVVGGDAAAFVDAAAAEAAAAGDNSHMAVHFDCTFLVSLFDFRLFIFL